MRRVGRVFRYRPDGCESGFCIGHIAVIRPGHSRVYIDLDDSPAKAAVSVRRRGSMNFALIFKFLVENLTREKIDFALMGGFALQSAGVARTTRDIDLLILSEDSPKIKEIMTKHKYRIIHESEDVLNFTGDDFELGRVDFLLAHRTYTLNMLKKAKEEPFLDGKFKIKVLKVEDQIGLKVQSSSNNPKRMSQDMADVRALIEVNYSKLNVNLVKEYFSLFKREKELETILKEIKNAKR